MTEEKENNDTLSVEQAEEQLVDELAQMRDQLLRAMAEAENIRRRASKEKEETARYAISNFARELLNVADNLRRAIESVSTDAAEHDPSTKALLAGVEMTESELLAVFMRFGIQKISPHGQPFDHNWHQAMLEIETTDHPAGHVTQVLQEGYKLHDRLLRPALVGVAKNNQVSD